MLAALLLLSPPAQACGGLFCSAGVPMDQSAERVVFAFDEDAGTVETHVRISYTGRSDRFAWIVPVPAVPEVGLSSEALFTALASWSQPSFWTHLHREGCPDGVDLDLGAFPSFPAGGGCCGGAGGGTNGGGGGGGVGGGGVTVLASGQTGPYDWKVVSAKDDSALRGWLQDPDGDPGTADAYDVPPSTSQLLAGYLDDGASFIAFRLAPGATTGDLAPVRLRWPGTEATIPLVLTAIASTPDLHLEVHVLGEHRAVPLNWLHVRLDEAAVSWQNGGRNYDDLVRRAADEAGGQAFVTDAFAEVRDRLIDAPTSAEMVALATHQRPIPFFDALAGLNLPGNDVLLEIFRRWLPMPQELVDQGVDDQAFYNCLRCWQSVVADLPFRPVGFAAELEERVAGPMRDAAAMLDAARYDTRLSTFVSPDEMTLDPRFGLNPSLDADLVPARRESRGVVGCLPDGAWTSDRPPRLLEVEGLRVAIPRLRDNTAYGAWITGLGLPAARVIERTGTDGAPVALQDQTQAIQALLLAAVAPDVTPDTGLLRVDTGAPDAADTDAADDTDAALTTPPTATAAAAARRPTWPRPASCSSPPRSACGAAPAGRARSPLPRGRARVATSRLPPRRRAARARRRRRHGRGGGPRARAGPADPGRPPRRALAAPRGA